MSKRKLRRATPVDALMEQVEESLLKIGVIRTLVYHTVYQKELLRVWVRTSLGSGQVVRDFCATYRGKTFEGPEFSEVVRRATEMRFTCRHRVFKSTDTEFTESTAPSWLTSENEVPGSTMDDSWFWIDHVCNLEVGKSIQTDFHTIKRIW